MKVKVTFLEPILGTWPGDPAVAERFIASKAKNEETAAEEIEAVTSDEMAEQMMTVTSAAFGKLLQRCATWARRLVLGILSHLVTTT